MRLVSKAALAAVSAAVSIGGTATTAMAMTPVTSGAAARAATSCDWEDLLGPDHYGGNSEFEFWLSYNPCTREVRGAVDIYGPAPVDEGWEVWAYNEDTGDTAENVDDPGSPSQIQPVYTQPIDDAGTLSHVCVQPYDDSSPAGVKQCTDYF